MIDIRKETSGLADRTRALSVECAIVDIHFLKDTAVFVLSEEALLFVSPERLVGSELYRVLQRIGVKTFAIDEDALELIVTNGYSIGFGARFLKRYIDEHVKLPISARWKDGSHFAVKAHGGELTVEPSISKIGSADQALAYGDVA